MKLRPATFDPLDASIFEGHEHYRELAPSMRAPHYQHQFWLDPANWAKYQPEQWILDLRWQTYRYSEVDTPDKLKHIATEAKPGIYMFSVEPEIRVRGFPSFLLYIGISNVNNSGRPVRDRLMDYLPTRIMTVKKRENIHRMACLFYSNIRVHFAYTEVNSNTLQAAEIKLHGFMAPLVAKAAYPAEMKKRKPAF